MGTVSFKIPCNRGGQNSISQALPETFAYKTRRRERGKCPLLNAFQVIYCLLRRQGLKNRNSIFISTSCPAGVKPY